MELSAGRRAKESTCARVLADERVSTMVSAKGRWGDLLEDEEELPAPTTTGPDAKGIVTRVEYSRNDKGEVVKRTIKSRVVKIEKRVYQVHAFGW